MAEGPLRVHEVVFNGGDVDEAVVRVYRKPDFLAAFEAHQRLPEWVVLRDIYGGLMAKRGESIHSIYHQQVIEVDPDADSETG